ncbi:hypothetical protein BpHYR1_031919, partial [Brachionus plicatilis]
MCKKHFMLFYKRRTQNNVNETSNSEENNSSSVIQDEIIVIFTKMYNLLHQQILKITQLNLLIKTSSRVCFTQLLLH